MRSSQPTGQRKEQSMSKNYLITVRVPVDGTLAQILNEYTQIRLESGVVIDTEVVAAYLDDYGVKR